MNRQHFESSLKAFIEHKYLCGILLIKGKDAYRLKSIIEEKSKTKIVQFIFEVAKTPFLDFKKEWDVKFIESAFDEIDISLDVYKNDNNELEYSVSFPINSIFDLMYEFESDFDIVSIYRLEDKDGAGIYTSDSIKPPEYKRHQKMPYEEKNFKFLFNKDSHGLKVRRTEPWFFGFKSIDDLEKWFGKDLDFMLEYITIYDVPQKFIIHGDKQLIFKKEKASFNKQYI